MCDLLARIPRLDRPRPTELTGGLSAAAEAQRIEPECSYASLTSHVQLLFGLELDNLERCSQSRKLRENISCANRPTTHQKPYLLALGRRGRRLAAKEVQNNKSAKGGVATHPHLVPVCIQCAL